MMRSILIAPLVVILLLGSPSPTLFAQGFGRPLTNQGIDQFAPQSVRSLAEGGISLGVQGDISLMFQDPASLQSIKGLQITLNDQRFTTSLNQDQQYGPLKYYSNFSLLMEGLTGYISNPDTTKPGVKYTNAGDTVQRPFDNIAPGWAHYEMKNPPLQGFIALPFSLGDVKCAVGLGSVEYANLNWFFENNNVLSPSILSVNQGTITIPANNTDSSSIPVQWYLSSQSRVGTIYGYGGAISVALTEEVSLGISGMALSGSSVDDEMRIDRGKLVFYNSYFRLDSIYNSVSSIGSSDYSGAEFTVSGSYRSRYILLGFSVKPPTAITRKFSEQVQTDTTGATRILNVKGQDKTTLPWRGTIGLSIALRENLRLSMAYEFRPYASAKYTGSDGSISYPWLSSNLFHLGAELTPLPWLALRGGVREEAEVYQPEGAPLNGDPVSYTVYSFGAGFLFGSWAVNFGYEYSTMNYTDMWADAISINGTLRHTIMADLTYQLPW